MHCFLSHLDVKLCSLRLSGHTGVIIRMCMNRSYVYTSPVVVFGNCWLYVCLLNRLRLSDKTFFMRTMLD